MELECQWFEYDYFPYEREFAEGELARAFSGVEITRRGEDVLRADVTHEGDWVDAAAELTYFQTVAAANESVVPTQAKLEIAEHAGRPIPADDSWGTYRLPRQQTRYSAHGVHEYKGKFNPQVVRAIGNLLGWEAGDRILDPFAGSGTTLVEANHRGWNAVGVEINPLAVKIANAKLSSLEIPADVLRVAATAIADDLHDQFAECSLSDPLSEAEMRSIAGPAWRSEIRGFDYLDDWFVDPVLVQIHAIEERIDAVDSAETRAILETILSDQLRDASLQDAGDLRTRRERDPPANYPLVPNFVAAVREFVETVLRARKHLPERQGTQAAVELDSRDFADELATELPDAFDGVQFDGALTSPPYASALPYVDTYRLSLFLFGHVETGEMRQTARSLVGSRSIRGSRRRRLYDAIEENAHGLPAECISFCRTLKDAVDPENDGFRRQNRPALVYRYLADMKESLRETYAVLKPGSPYALVVGRNTTVLGGEEYRIDNPALLAALVKQVGYSVRTRLELDAHHRFDMHNASHSIDTEQLLVLEKRG